MKKLRAAVIGTGSIGSNHVRVLTEIDGVDLIGAYDSQRQTLISICEKHSVKAYNSIEELMDGKPDMVSVAVPASEHERVAIGLIKNSIPLLLEKPIAHTVESAKAILDAAKTFDTPVMIGHIERFNPAIAALKKYLADQTILSIDITRVGPTPPRVKDVGITVDLGIHDIDLVTYLSGRKIFSVSSAVRSTRGDIHEDIAMLLIKLDDGSIAQIHSNWLTPVKTRALQVATAKEFIRADLIARTVSIYNRFPDNDDASFITTLPIENIEPLKAEIGAFITALKTGSPIPVTIDEGFAALQTAIECLDKSI